ncbi:MAG: chemotaxis response regulator protein-glutamate methylesterase [Gammaproteobacteria bacterium]|nr:chemotaxis response regulator protein-glutamate methylesterase [Gammaproteobacteria bacterium]
MNKVRVLVIDDSALMRKLLTQLLDSDPIIEVVGTAMDAYVARDKIKSLKPDVITLDIEMPKMDGLSFLSNLMRLHPMPVVMVSTLTERGADTTLRALSLGAVDFVTKPKIDVTHSLEDCAEEICSKVKAAASASLQILPTPPRVDTRGAIAKLAKSNGKLSRDLIAIGASTGGTEAIKEVLVRLHPDSPGVVIAQHIPPVFSRSFAERMNKCSPLTVTEAHDGQQIFPGHAYVAPGDRHLEVVRKGAEYYCQLNNGERVNRHKPSVDVLFDSVADQVGDQAVGVILTGMGRDGAKGLRRMHNTGAPTIAQDQQTSVVWGMPGSAVDEGGADKQLPLNLIAANLNEICRS